MKASDWIMIGSALIFSGFIPLILGNLNQKFKASDEKQKERFDGINKNIDILRTEATKRDEANTAAHKEFWQEINGTKLKVKGVSMVQRLCKTCTDHISPDLDDDNPVQGG